MLYYFAMKAKEIAPNIVIDPNIMFGKPVIKGTRVPVDLILGKIAAGNTIEQLTTEYGLTQEGVRSALRYAERIVKEETLIPLD